MDPEAKALDYHDVLLRQGDVQLLDGPHWLNDQVRAWGEQRCRAAPPAAPSHSRPLSLQCCLPIQPTQVIAFFFEYLQRERFAGAGALLFPGDATFLLANLGEQGRGAAAFRARAKEHRAAADDSHASWRSRGQGRCAQSTASAVSRNACKRPTCHPLPQAPTPGPPWCCSSAVLLPPAWRCLR